MNRFPCFLDLPNAKPERAHVLLLPLPYEGTVSYGRGTATAPLAIWTASQHVECWDEELDWDLDGLEYHTAEPVWPQPDSGAEPYCRQVEQRARALHRYSGLVAGVGGEHSVTPALMAAACAHAEDFSHTTVVQIDAHADLRDQYQGTRCSHACAMRRVLEKQAKILAIGIRSADRHELRHGHATGRVQTYFAQQLAEDQAAERNLLDALDRIRGDCYLTVDMDGLDCTVCPATGTPQPGGLGWWQTLRYLRRLLLRNREVHLIGCDVVETVPQPHSQVNEMAAAKMLAKIVAYWFHRRACNPGDPPYKPMDDPD